jgi:hypothetical protein
MRPDALHALATADSPMSATAQMPGMRRGAAESPDGLRACLPAVHRAAAARGVHAGRVLRRDYRGRTGVRLRGQRGHEALEHMNLEVLVDGGKHAAKQLQVRDGERGACGERLRQRRWRGGHTRRLLAAGRQRRPQQPRRHLRTAGLPRKRCQCLAEGALHHLHSTGRLAQGPLQ